MEILFYPTFKEFEIKHLSDFRKQNTYSYYEFLNLLLTKHHKESNLIFESGIKKITRLSSEGKFNEEYEVRTELYEAMGDFAQISKHLQLEIEREKTTIKLTTNNENTEEVPENDFSDTLPLERMILAEKTGVIKYCQSILLNNSNEKNLAELLSGILAIPSTTIAKNLGVMLGVKKDDTNKNSPYKNPKNLQLANKKLNQLKIDLTKIFK